MTQLPEELIVEILLWLPVESLLRFKCLSKSSCAMIDGPNFTNWHLINTSSQNFNLRKMIFPDRSREEIHVCDVNVDLEEDILHIEQPVISLWGEGCVGNCNGLLLLYQTLIYPFGFAVENPSTGRYRDLPDCPCEVPPDADHTRLHIMNMSGLGYDDSTDDYKVILSVDIERGFGEIEVQFWIYGLKSSIWRRIQNFPYLLDTILDEEIGYFVDGSLHWICPLRNFDHVFDRRKEIVAFDVRNETFSLVSQPVICSIKEVDSVDSVSPKLHVFEGCLWVSYFYDSKPVVVDLFIRKKDGVDQFSWTKFFSVTEPVSFNIRYFRRMKVLRYSKRGDKILLDLGFMFFMVSYDLRDKSFRKVEILEDYDWRSPIVCLESRVHTWWSIVFERPIE